MKRHATLIAAAGLAMLTGPAALAAPSDTNDASTGDDNTVLYFSFDGEGPQVKDQSGNQHAGYIQDAERVPGYEGQAIAFAGGESAVEVPHDPALDFGDASDFTLEARIKTDTTERWGYILTKKLRVEATEPGYQIYLNPTHKAQVSIADGHNSVLLVGTTPLNDDVWHHIAVVAKRDGDVTLYVDGQVEAKASMESLVDVSNPRRPLLIGSRGHDASFDGLIDDVRLSNAAREIKPATE